MDVLFGLYCLPPLIIGFAIYVVATIIHGLTSKPKITYVNREQEEKENLEYLAMMGVGGFFDDTGFPKK
jgi:hypothetical protein